MRIKSPFRRAQYHIPRWAGGERYADLSPHIWRESYHMRFSYAYGIAERLYLPPIKSFVDDAFKTVLSPHIAALGCDVRYFRGFCDKIAEECADYLAPYRIAALLPPEGGNNFDVRFAHWWRHCGSVIYYAFCDVFNQMAYLKWPIDYDDFNVIDNRAFTGKVDRTALSVKERADAQTTDRTALGEGEKSGASTGRKTEADILTGDVLGSKDSSAISSDDNYSDSGKNALGDTYLSPQNQGAKPLSAYTRASKMPHDGRDSGSDAIKRGGEEAAKFHSTGTAASEGSSSMGNDSKAAAARQAAHDFEQHNDVRTGETSASEVAGEQNVQVGHTATDAIGGGQDAALMTNKADNYQEGLHFDRIKQLTSLNAMFRERLFIELISRLRPLILQISLATPLKWYGADRREYD